LMPSLELIGQTSAGRANVPSAESLGPDGYLNDTNRVSLRLYHANIVSNGTEIVAVSVMNPSSEDTISVNQLYIQGYISLNDGIVESVLLYRPVISLPYDVIEPTSTRPMRIPPGDSITAYLEGSFDIDSFGASACYMYAEKAKQLDIPNQYCFYSKQQ
jgi:hypothetical protein